MLSLLMQAIAVVMCNSPLVVLRHIYVVRDARMVITAVVVAAHLLGIVEELPGKQRFHLKRKEIGRVREKKKSFSSFCEPKTPSTLISVHAFWLKSEKRDLKV